VEIVVFQEEMFLGSDVSLNVAAGPVAGSPLLLLHGVTRTWQDFMTLAPSLGWRWHVHALDLRGHGRSGRAPGHYRVIDYAHDVISFVQEHQKSPWVIYGHSLGALVAAAVAAEAPGAVRALVLEDPPGPSLLHNLRATPFHALLAALQFLAGNGRSVPEIARALAEVRLGGDGAGTGARLGDVRDATSLRFSARCLTNLDPDVLTSLLAGRWLDGYDVETIFTAIRCPVLLLRADDRAGGMLPGDDAQALEKHLNDCTRIDLPGVGHLLHWLATAEIVRYTVGFLESL
jgi:pimeloyl-ACP methyl ester carboxylesterase